MFAPHKECKDRGISVKPPISHSQLSKAGLSVKPQWRMLTDSMQAAHVYLMVSLLLHMLIISCIIGSLLRVWLSVRLLVFISLPKEIKFLF